MIEVKFCENNFVHGTEDLVKRLEQKENIKVTVDSCLGYCGDCASGPYALVNDELIQTNTVEELYDAILETQ